MTKRQEYIFAYDICDENQQERLRKILKAYAIGSQASLYECWLNEAEHQKLVAQVQKILSDDDRCLSFLRPKKFILYGSAKPLQYHPFIVS